ncbi:hypothetical protein DdX_02637 [Ditylenchus destructor]|uniref:RING-type domain-containing protein n=1 Tax=Ditylenchus destructor TaxID=166010 RepID=A0AAD4NHZ6_9BILA|nr:hypothetical protein DdX_02637 [Ditylenchus destructor]
MITRSMAKRAARSRDDNNTAENEPIASRTRNNEGGRIDGNNHDPRPIPAGPSQASTSPQQRRRRTAEAEPTNVNDLTVSNDGNEPENPANLSDSISEHGSDDEADDDHSGLISENGSDDDSDGMSAMSFFHMLPLPLFRILVTALNEDDDISFVSASDGDTSSESVVKLSDISAASENENIKNGENTEARNPVSCIICAEENVANAVKSTCCGQVIGCKDCVKRWYRTTNISALNVASPLSRGQSHENHQSCPYCRRPWPNEMLIEPY